VIEALIIALALTAAPSFQPPSPADLDALIASVQGKSASARVDSLSARFLGMPYVDGPLGEGYGKDPDPIVRYDEADCQTYVETVMALASSHDAAQATDVLQRIRYFGSTPRYDERNHFTEFQWVPNAEKRGFLREITRDVGGKEVIETGKENSRDAWAKRTMSREIDLPEDKAPIGSVHFAIIPLAALERVAPKIPQASIMLIVRKDMPGYMTRISHLGFVVHHDGSTFVRHAGSVAGHVLDEEVSLFAARHRKFAKWPVDGVRLFAVEEAPAPPPAAAAKPGAAH
jgi:hypothetical protein